MITSIQSSFCAVREVRTGIFYDWWGGPLSRMRLGADYDVHEAHYRMSALAPLKVSGLTLVGLTF